MNLEVPTKTSKISEKSNIKSSSRTNRMIENLLESEMQLKSELDASNIAEVFDSGAFNNVVDHLNLQVPSSVKHKTLDDYESSGDSKKVELSQRKDVSKKDSALKKKFNATLANEKEILYSEMIKSERIRTTPTELEQRAEQVTKKIVTDFVEWFDSLGHPSAESLVTVEHMMDMFSMRPNLDGRGALKVEYRRFPKLSKNHTFIKGWEQIKDEMLLHELNKDKELMKIKPRIMAFGKALPLELKTLPTTKIQPPKILEGVPHSKKYLASMAEVFEGITHLKSTRSFAEYLSKVRTDVKPPSYFIEAGLMDNKMNK